MGDGVAKVARRLQEAKETGKLDLSSCDLTQVPDAVYFMMKNVAVETCDLSNNLIKRIPSKFTTKFPSLTELDLRANRLTSLPDECRSLEELKVLDLSQNKFEGLPAFIYGSTKLKRLYARDNKITDVDTDKLRKMLTLTEVDLQDNPLTTETADKLRDIDVFTVQVGESDPAGKQLDNVE